MKVVVTGANGFIGVHTVRALLEKGYKVVAVDLNFNNLEPNPNLELTQGNICDHDFKKLLNHGDKVIHLAAISRFAPAKDNPQRAVRVNVEGTLNVVQACIAKKVDRIIFSSTGSVYSFDAHVPIREDAPRQPSNVYGLTKKMAEDWIMFYGRQLPYVILRYGYIYGLGKDWGAIGSFLKKLFNDERPVVFGGDQVIDFTYVKDVVQANLLALETPYTNEVYNIGTGRATSIKDVCEYCIKAVGSRVKMKIAPARPFEYPIFIYNINHARSLLGYEPRWNGVKGITDMVNQLKQ